MKFKEITNEFPTLSNERRGPGEVGGGERGSKGRLGWSSKWEKLFETLTRAPSIRCYVPISFGKSSEICENA